ncbi:DUF2489 domain-containing protein [Vibrio salinus]|uniref:DUF2489 domain-containing protein n=1 Tax=Vibrio salinus TaxID=2899784 RepID=UPI001E54571F|nr:DUF2489 domain-containing protein [Vibrio salinus]MCE0493562.1 DUF2489 domain-containing protein [Vibrio salinus]
MYLTILASIGGIIIIGLASYAASLFVRLKKQTKLQEEVRKKQVELEREALHKRNANIFESVETLCKVGIQGQCDLSEITIRVYRILEYVQGDARIDVEKSYPALTELYHTVKDMARGDARKALAKKERMKQNMQRMKAEGRLGDLIKEELKLLQQKVKVHVTDKTTSVQLV